jgi:hypothetical protein
MARHPKAWPRNGLGMPTWMNLRWPQGGPAEKPISELPKVKLFPSNKVAILRSGWDLSPKSTDTLAAVYCRPYEGHCHRDAGHFNLWRGQDELTGDGGFYANTNVPFHSNYFTATVAHNCVLIHDPKEPLLGSVGYGIVTANDGGQVRGDGPHYGRQDLRCGWYRGEIENFTDDARFSYLFADITPAYSSFKAVRVARAFFWLKPSTYVICDWVRSVKPDLTKQWLLQSATRPTVQGSQKIVRGTSEAGIIETMDGRRATITSGRSKLELQVLAPERTLVRHLGGQGYASWVDGQNVEPPANMPMNADGGRKLEAARKAALHWRLEVEATEPSNDTVFLNVLDATAADAQTPPSAALVRRGEAVGATLTRGGTASEILFYPDGRASIDGQTIGKALAPLPPTAPEK